MGSILIASGPLPTPSIGAIAVGPDGDVHTYKNGEFVSPLATAQEGIDNAQQALTAVTLLASKLDVARFGLINGFVDGFADTAGINAGASTYSFTPGKCTPQAGGNEVPNMTGPTTPSGVASASTEFGSGYAAWKAFDNVNASESDAWLPSNINLPQWLQYEFSTPRAIGGYELTTRNYPGSYINTWVLKGSNNGTDFTDIDTVASAGFNGANQTQSFSIDDPGSYTFYRLHITGTVGSGDFGVGMFKLMGLPSDIMVTSITVPGQDVSEVAFTAVVKDTGWTFEINTGSGWQAITTTATDSGGGLFEHTAKMTIEGTSITVRATSTEALAELHGWGVFWK